MGKDLQAALYILAMWVVSGAIVFIGYVVYEFIKWWRDKKNEKRV